MDVVMEQTDNCYVGRIVREKLHGFFSHERFYVEIQRVRRDKKIKKKLGKSGGVYFNYPGVSFNTIPETLKFTEQGLEATVIKGFNLDRQRNTTIIPRDKFPK